MRIDAAAVRPPVIQVRGPAPAAGIWRLADPKVSLASIASMTLGTAAAAREGPLAWAWLALTVAGILAIEVAKNASGELVDFESGVDQAVAPEDRSPFSGGKRVLLDGLLSRPQAAVVALLGYGAGIAIGITLAVLRHPGVLWLGIVGVSLAYFYHSAPLRLSYRGLGEIAVTVTYGPLIACGTYLVQRLTWDASVLWASLPLGVLIGAFLWINEFPDYRADRQGDKRTQVVRLGPRLASRLYAVLILVAYALLAALPMFGLPRTVFFGFAGLPFSVWAACRLAAWPEATPRIVPAQAASLLAFIVYALGVSAGLLTGRVYMP